MTPEQFDLKAHTVGTPKDSSGSSVEKGVVENTEPVTEKGDEIVWDNSGDIARNDKNLRWKIEERKRAEEVQRQIRERIDASTKEEERKRRENSLLAKLRRSLGI